MKPQHKGICPLCGDEKTAAELVPVDLVRHGVTRLIRQDHPDWGGSGSLICLSDLNRYRARYVQGLIADERGELTALETEVIRRLEEQELVTADVNREFDNSITFGDRLSDRVARFGGSWAFILTFGAFLGIWMVINALLLRKEAFDPYPFILLNLILSTIAALQAPVIMMSQNRQESKDRLRAEHDYRVNLKAELEIRLLGERLDTLLSHQWQRLLEIQQIQIELMEELGQRREQQE